MKTNRTSVRMYAAALLLAFSMAAPALAETNLNARLAKIEIDNFGRINDNYYRGAQPRNADYRDLAGLGVRTVIDLTADGRADEEGLVKQAHMKFYRIPMTTTDRPSQTAIAEFLK